MQLSELRYFLMVVEAGSFGKAARLSRLRVSTLSRAVSRLEDQLGVALLERTSSGILITPSGRIALNHVRRVLNETSGLSEALTRSSIGEIGEIHLGFHFPPTNSIVISLLLKWRIDHPDVGIVPHEPNTNTLLAALIDRQVDAVLIPDFLLNRYSEGYLVYSEPLVAVLPAGHRLASNIALKWTDLKHENLLLWAWARDDIGRDFFASRMPDANLRVFEISNMTLLSFVRAGYGVTITAQAYSKLNLPGVAFIPIDETDAHIDVHLAYRQQSEDPVIGKFVAFMRDRAKSYR